MASRTDLLEAMLIRPNWVVGRYHNMVLTVRRTAPTVEELAEIQRMFEQTIDRFPGGQVVIQNSIPSAFGFPGEPVRGAIVDFMHKTEGKLLLLAVVSAHNPLFRAAVRSFLLGAKMLGRLKTPIEIYADLREAVARGCQLAQPHARIKLDLDEIMACLETLRLRLLEQPTS